MCAPGGVRQSVGILYQAFPREHTLALTGGHFSPPLRCCRKALENHGIRLLCSRRGVHCTPEEQYHVLPLPAGEHCSPLRMIQKTLSIKKRADISVRPYDVAARLLKIMAYVSFTVVGACSARPRNNITFCRYPRATARPYE